MWHGPRCVSMYSYIHTYIYAYIYKGRGFEDCLWRGPRCVRMYRNVYTHIYIRIFIMAIETVCRVGPGVFLSIYIHICRFTYLYMGRGFDDCLWGGSGVCLRIYTCTNINTYTCIYIGRGFEDVCGVGAVVCLCLYI